MTTDGTEAGPTSTDGRNETPLQRQDRNWADLLQELRIIQTGVQLLTGFLLILPFQQRFATLTHLQHAVYLATAGVSIVATVFLQAPVVVHRVVFGRHRREETVLIAHRLVIVGIGLLGCAVLGVTFLIVSALLGSVPATVAVSVILVLIGVLWGVVPLVALRREPPS